MQIINDKKIDTLTGEKKTPGSPRLPEIKRTLSELIKQTKLKREEAELLSRKHLEDLELYSLAALAYGASEVHHQTRKKALKLLQLESRLEFKSEINQKTILSKIDEIVAFKKSSPKSAPAFDRTLSEERFERIFSSETKKHFQHSVVIGNHVQDNLVPSYTFRNPFEELSSSSRLRCYGAVIEIDGWVHHHLPEKIKADEQKEIILKHLGIALIRINNADVKKASTKAIIKNIKDSSLYTEGKKILFKRINLYTLVVCLNDKEFKEMFGVSRSRLRKLNYKKIIRDSKAIKANDFVLPRIVD